jgi:osmoprotectant transport system permease protein
MSERIETTALHRLWTGSLLLFVFALGAWAYGSGLLPTMLDLADDIDFLARQHLMLVGVSGALAVFLGVPLGIALTRPRLRRHADLALQFLNIGATIPTLALLALSMSILGIGAAPAIFGLFVVTLLPIVANTLAAVRSVPPHLIDAARGMGMSDSRILWQVELPNAMFVIYAGIRTALAVNVGTAPLAFLIGGGGLGELIFTGIALNEFGMMLAGAIPTAFIAIIVDFMVGQLQLWTIPRGVNPLR